MARAVTAVLLVVAWVLTWRPALDPDLWWHLALGDLILADGAIPSTEPWSWWTSGAPLVAHSWLWEVVLALAYAPAGPVGASMLGAAISGLAVALLWLLARTVFGETPAPVRAAVVVLAVATALVFWSPRAQSVDLVAVLAIALVWERHLRGSHPRELVVLPVVSVLWVNLHGSAAPAGLVATLTALGLGTVLGDRLRRWPRRPRRALLVASVAAVVALLINPYCLGILTYPFDPTVASAFSPEIQEWAAPQLGAPGLLVFWIGLGGLLLAAVLPRLRLGEPAIVLLALGWTVAALLAARFVLIGGPLVMLVVATPVASELVGRWRRSSPRPPSPAGGRVLGGIAAVACALILAVGWSSIAPDTQQRLIAARFPVAAVERMVAAGCDGRLLNGYDWGGYLIRHGSWDVGAYGNSPGSVVTEQAELEALRGDPAGLLAARDVDLALVPASGPLASWLRSADGWSIGIDDGRTLLAVRDGHPGCQRL